MVIFLPGLAFANSSNSHLQLSEEGRKSLESVALNTLDKQALDYHERLISESLKMRPSANLTQKTAPIPENKPFGDERFVVVPVLDSDCKLSPFWTDICRNVEGAKVFDGPPGSLPMLVIRKVPGMPKDQLGVNIAGAMVFLEEASDDSPCIKNATEKEAARCEHSAKEKAAYELRHRLSLKLLKAK